MSDYKADSEADLFHFYVPGLAEGVTQLPADEVRHAVSALRMKEGDRFTATDGLGFWADCVLEKVGKGHTLFRKVESRQYPKPVLELHIYVGPTKNHDRLEWLAEKLQELGIAGLHVCFTEHSVRKSINKERLVNVAISALKQSRSTYLLDISDDRMEDMLRKAKSQNNTQQSTNMFCYLGPLAESKKLSQDAITRHSGVINLFLGPEGDFSQKEIEWMLLNEFQPIRLTNTRLRTETAALAVASTWMCLA